MFSSSVQKQDSRFQSKTKVSSTKEQYQVQSEKKQQKKQEKQLQENRKVKRNWND
jgi:hypothetical protein